MATATIDESIRPVYVPYEYDESAESLDDYKPGGFHPTHLGDLLGQDCRYRVVHKLGHGGFGTVWLCRDMKENKWRAVKILAAEHSTGHCADLRICEMLEGLSPREKDAHVSHVVVPEDHFWHEGPNGNHLCVVMPVLGPSLEDVTEKLQHQEEPLKRICYQLVLAMKFLHGKGICHGDFRPINICYILNDLDNLEEEDLLRLFGRPTLLCLVDDGEYDWRSDVEGYGEEDDEGDLPIEDEEDDLDEIEEVESSPEASEDDAQSSSGDDHEPRYLVVTPLLDKASKYVSDHIAVIDFGESFLTSNALQATGIPQPYRPPEAFFENCGTFGIGSDIWALGCSIFEVKNGSKAFFSDFWTSLSYWEDLNGPLPEPYRSAFAKAGEDVPDDPSQWVSLDEEAKKERVWEHNLRAGVPGFLHKDLLLEREFTVPLAEGEEQPLRTRVYGLLAPAGRKVLSYEMSQSEALQLLDLFKKTFAWMPEDRITAAEILNHPWFDSCRDEEDSENLEGSASDMSSASDSVASDEDELDEAVVPYCGVMPMLPWLVRGLRQLYGL